MPYFSIIVPTFNRASKLQRLLTSVLEQSFSDFELIVVDDGSTDNTSGVVSAFKDSRIKYLKKDNNERAIARNFGLLLSTGRYVNYFDSDDLMYKDRLQQVYDFVQMLKEPEVIFTHYDFADDEGRVVGTTERFAVDFTENLWFNNFLATGAVFLKRDVAVPNLFNEDRRLITAEDWELWLRIHKIYTFHECRLRTFAIVQHEARSIITIPCDRIEVRDTFFADLVASDPAYVDRYGRDVVSLFVADRYSFIALMFAINSKRCLALKYLRKSLGASISVLRRKRFWGVLKNLL
jgi:glycosyltransferase involved in cell wall biosynthesis